MWTGLARKSQTTPAMPMRLISMATMSIEVYP